MKPGFKMDHYKRMVIFTKVVEQGSMSGAARILNMSPSAVSQQIRYLEKISGITLIHRSTRKLSLTEIGQRYYFYCKQVAQAAENAQALLDTEKKEPFGELRISAPVGLSNYFIESLKDWSQALPHLNLNIQVQDQYIDLITERIDLAIRVGEMPSSSFIAHKISEMHMKVYASPAWVEKHGMPTHPNELGDENWLHLQYSTNDTMIQKYFFHESTYTSYYAEIKPKYLTNNTLILHKMCEQGYGVCCLSTFEAEQALLEGKLVKVLDDWNVGTMNIWAVTTQKNTKSAKVTQAIEYIKRKLKPIQS